MELTLIPLAAILLLLSGASGRVAVSEGPATSAAWIRLFLTEDAEQGRSEKTVRAKARRPSAPVQRLSRAGYLSARRRVAERAKLLGRKLAHILLRSRFGVASVAFRSMAPPVA